MTWKAKQVKKTRKRKLTEGQEFAATVKGIVSKYAEKRRKLTTPAEAFRALKFIDEMMQEAGQPGGVKAPTDTIHDVGMVVRELLELREGYRKTQREWAARRDALVNIKTAIDQQFKRVMTGRAPFVVLANRWTPAGGER